MHTTVTARLTAHHRHCDDLLAEAERAAKQNWERCTERFKTFRDSLETHLQAEEQQLFPAVEPVLSPVEGPTLSTGGPTSVMRAEHEDMRGLLRLLEGSIEAADAEGFQGLVETLFILMQQHNMKEENVLYPLCDRILQGSRSMLADTLKLP